MSNFKGGRTAMVALRPAQNQSITFRDEAGSEITLTQQDVLQYVCPTAEPKEVVYFMELCRAQRLNPFLKEAFLIKYGNNPASMVVAEIVFERRANNHPDYVGMEAGVVYLDSAGNICKREGTATYKVAGELLVGGWARVHRRGRTDSYAEVTIDEYDKGRSLWKTMPGVMIGKCAKGVALRMAFPTDFQGMYLEEEIGDENTLVTEVHAEVLPDTPEDAPESAPEPNLGPIFASDEQIATLNNLVANLASLRGVDAAGVANAVCKSKAVTATGYEPGNRLTVEQCEVAVRVAGAWLEKAMAESEGQADPQQEQDGGEQE